MNLFKMYYVDICEEKKLTPPTSNQLAALESLCLLYMYSKIYNTLPTLIKLYRFLAYRHANMKSKKLLFIMVL